jgi:hypothetical protein
VRLEGRGKGEVVRIARLEKSLKFEVWRKKEENEENEGKDRKTWMKETKQWH